MEDMFFVASTSCIDEWLTSSHRVWYLRRMLHCCSFFQLDQGHVQRISSGTCHRTWRVVVTQGAALLKRQC